VQDHAAIVKLCAELIALGATEVQLGEFRATFGKPRQTVEGPATKASRPRRPRTEDLTPDQRIAQAERVLEDALKAYEP
jgi:hypothetical protein